VPDTWPGRFELVVLHGVLATRRLNTDPEAHGLAQAVSNRLFSTFDEALREVGEGDLTVAKRMKGLARAFLGRLGAYGAGLDAKDEAALAGAMARNIWNIEESASAGALARYALGVEAALAERALDDLAQVSSWPEPAL
jgi:cytochrome b pre-mRNA-processing protein 3